MPLGCPRRNRLSRYVTSKGLKLVADACISLTLCNPRNLLEDDEKFQVELSCNACKRKKRATLNYGIYNVEIPLDLELGCLPVKTEDSFDQYLAVTIVAKLLNTSELRLATKSSSYSN